MTTKRIVRRLTLEELEPRIAPSAYNYWVTPSTTDGRFMALAGTGVDTIQTSNQIEFGVPQGTASLNIGIFDGETGGLWDEGTQPLLYTLYADPKGDGSNLGSAGAVVGSWMGSSMPDNDWYNISAPTSGTAVGVDGNQYYTLDVRAANPDPNIFFISAYKLRTDATNFVMPQNFSFYAPMPTVAEARVIYPNWDQGDLTTTTYDGTWDFSFWVPSTTTSVTVWDGDFDYGSYDLTANDTNDPNAPGIPSWAVNDPGIRPQGVAVGLNGATGNPPDDSEWEWYRRSPSVTYTLTDAGGNSYPNGNPSGNSEWEKFVVTSDDPQADPNEEYYVPNPLSAGTYNIHVDGLDVGNLVLWRIEYPPINTEPKLHAVGDTVWWDDNHNGIQDNGEPGIPGIQVDLVNAQNTVIGTTTTNSSGWYDFSGLWPGYYTVQVDSSNFTTGGALKGFATSTGNTLTRQVVNADVMTYDFGYYGATIGDYVWHDTFHSMDHQVDGIQDAGEPAIPGVTVQLYNSLGSLVGAQTTGAAGDYHFTRLAADTYTVKIADSNFASGGPLNTGRVPWYATLQNAGADPTINSKGDYTTHSATVTLPVGGINENMDFGFFRTGLEMTKSGSVGPVTAIYPTGMTWGSPTGHFYDIYNPTNNPFYSIKFSPFTGTGINNGETDYMIWAMPNGVYDPTKYMNIQIHIGGGSDPETYFNFSFLPVEGQTGTQWHTITAGSKSQYSYVTCTISDVTTDALAGTTQFTFSVTNGFKWGTSYSSYSLPGDDQSQFAKWHFTVTNTGDLVQQNDSTADPLLNPTSPNIIWSSVVLPGQTLSYDRVYTPTQTGVITNYATTSCPAAQQPVPAGYPSGIIPDLTASANASVTITVVPTWGDPQGGSDGAAATPAAPMASMPPPADTGGIVVVADLAQSEAATTTEADSPAPAATETPTDDTLTAPAADATLAILSGPITVAEDLGGAETGSLDIRDLLANYPQLWSTDTETTGAVESEAVSAPQTAEDYVVSQVQVVSPDAGTTGGSLSDYFNVEDADSRMSSNTLQAALLRLDSSNNP